MHHCWEIFTFRSNGRKMSAFKKIHISCTCTLSCPPHVTNGAQFISVFYIHTHAPAFSRHAWVLKHRTHNTHKTIQCHFSLESPRRNGYESPPLPLSHNLSICSGCVFEVPLFRVFAPLSVCPLFLVFVCCRRLRRHNKWCITAYKWGCISAGSAYKTSHRLDSQPKPIFLPCSFLRSMRSLILYYCLDIVLSCILEVWGWIIRLAMCYRTHCCRTQYREIKFAQIFPSHLPLTILDNIRHGYPIPDDTPKNHHVVLLPRDQHHKDWFSQKRKRSINFTVLNIRRT